MAVGSNLAGVARVAFQAETGQFNAELAAAEARYARTTGVMSDDAIRMSLAQDKLNRALSRFGPESRQAQSATLALRAAQRQTASTSGTLSHELSSVNRSSREAASGLHVFTRDVERASAGAAIGSRAIRGLRSVVLFGGASVLGGFGAATAVRAFVTAAREQEQVQAGIRSQLHALGLSYGQYRGEIDRTLQAQSKMSAFDDEELGRSFTTLVRRTGDVSKALQLNALAANIARARHSDLLSTADLLTKALNGNARAASTLNLPLVAVTKAQDALVASGEKVSAQQLRAAKAQDKQATGLAVLDDAQRRYAGRAQAYANTSAGAQDRFNKVLQDSEEIIGRAITPALAHLANSLAAYLTKLNDSGRLQKDVNHIVRDGTQAAHAFGDALHAINPFLTGFNRLVGGTRHEVRLLIALFAAWKLGALEFGLKGIAGSIRGVGAAAATTAPEVNAVAAAEARAGGAAATATGEMNAFAASEARAGSAGGGGGFIFGPAGQIPNRDLRTPRGGRGGGGGGGFGPGGVGLGFFGTYPDAPNGVPLAPDAARILGVRAFFGKPPQPGAAVTVKGHTYIVAYDGQGRMHLLTRQQAEPLPKGGSPVPHYPGGSATTTTTAKSGFRDLTYPIRQAVSDAGLTASLADDRAAAVRAAAFLRNELRTVKLTHAQRLQLTDELGSYLATIRSIDEQASQKVSEARRKAREAAKRREAAERAAHLAVLGRRQTGIENRITRAQTREENAGNLTALRKAQRQEQQGYRDLIAFYTTEARDSRLTASQRTAARRNAARSRRDLTRAIVKDQEEARTRREDTLKLSVTNAQAALDSATKGTAQWTKAKERLDRAYSAEIAFYTAEAKNEKLSLKAKAKARQQAADATKQKAQLDKGGKGSQSDAAALIREFLSEQRGLYGGASNVFTEPKPDSERTPGTTVVVNQHFNAPPTTNRHREAIYANRAMRSAFDS